MSLYFRRGFACAFGKEPGAAVEIDDVGYRGDGAAQHLLFQGGCDAHIFHRIFQAEAEIKDVLHLLAEIVVSHRNGVASALAQDQKQVTDVFQGGDMLQKAQCNQMGDLVGEIMNILEEFWYGNIEPAEYDTSSSKEYKELLQLISRNEDKLLATMTDEQKEMFTKYADCVREYQVMAECLLFQNSFRLGGRMMLEIMRGGIGNE